MTTQKAIKATLLLFITTFCLSTAGNLMSQNIELLLKGLENTEADLWKKQRLNYYLDSKEMYSSNPESFFYRGQEKLQSGIYDKAIEDFKKAISSDDLPSTKSINANEEPTKRLAYLSIGICFQQINSTDSALYYYQKAINEDYYYLDAYIQKAFLLADINKPADAIAFLDIAEGVFPSSKKVYFAKAQIYLQQNKISKTKKYLAKATKIDPNFDEANILLASLHIHSNNVSGAMSILTKSIEKGKKPITSLYYRSMIYKAKDKYEKAYHDLNWAYYLDTINSPVLPELFMLDYYFENYKRANHLLSEFWNKQYNKNSKPVNWIGYQGFEYGYFVNHIVDSTTSEGEIAIFNSIMHKLALKENNLASNEIRKYANDNDSSLFAIRLEILVEFIDKPVYTFLSRHYNKTLDFTTTPRTKYFKPDLTDQIDIINHVLSYDSTILSMYWGKAISYFELNNYEKALETANKAIAIDSTYLESYMIRAFSNMYLQNYSASIPDYIKLNNSDYITVNTNFPLAYLYFKTGNYDKALKLISERVDYDTYSSIDINNKAICYEMSNQLDSALVYYNIASKKGSSFNSTYIISMARVLKKKGDYQEALSLLLQRNRQKYSDFMLLVDIADTYVEMNELENAISFYKKAFIKDNSYTYAYLGAADCHRKLKQYTVALDYYNIAIEKMPEYANSYYGKGLCYFDLEEYDKSGAAAYEAIQLDNEFADAYKLMADSYFLLGRYSVSISMGYNAVKYNPADKEALYKLAASILASGKSDQAISLYRDIVVEETTNKSTAYYKAIDTLRFMVLNNIQTESAKVVLGSVFNKQ